MLVGLSVDYYWRLERGNLAGASESVLEAVARALRLDDAERQHLLDLSRHTETAAARWSAGPKAAAAPRSAVTSILPGMTRSRRMCGRRGWISSPPTSCAEPSTAARSTMIGCR
jgi:Helix-turn-helix domain